MFISSTFLLCDIICSVADQTRSFIFFPSIAIHLQWVLSWAGCRSLGLGQNVPGHSRARAAVPQDCDHYPQLKYLTMSSIQPESQKHKSVPSVRWKPVLSHAPDSCLCSGMTACSDLAVTEVQLEKQPFCSKAEIGTRSHLSLRTLTRIGDKEGRNIFICPNFVIT